MQKEDYIVMILLRLLTVKDLYGYEMMEKLEILSNEYFKLKAGTLYPILHNMEELELIESYEEKADNGRMRKYYCIKNKGRKALKEKKSQWDKYVLMINNIVEGEIIYDN
ncbi:MAG: PadR family transcriptional regulator [Tissierellia bacterium]|nr:PadR family transcriptional regulator [Tissierellia bacterium]